MSVDASEKILIVDDQQINIDILENLLMDDYDISFSLDGKTALESIKNEKPDLILLDVMMPEMSGFEMLDILRNKMGITNISVILLTALDSLENQEDRLKHGVVDYITKPFDPLILIASVRKQFKVKSQ